MRLARIINQRLRSLFRSTRVETDLHRELDLHLEQLEKQYLAAGVDAPNLAPLDIFDPDRAALVDENSPRARPCPDFEVRVS